MNEEAPGLVGFPEMWKPVCDKYQPLFDTAVKGLSICHEIIGQCGFTKGVDLVTLTGTFTGGVELTVCRMVGASSNTLGALLTLVLNRYGPDALRLSRSIYETELNVFWLKEHPEDIEDFLGYEAIRRKQRFDQLDQARRKLVPEVTSAEIQADYDSIRQRFVRPGKTKLRHDWCRVTLRDRAAAYESLLPLHDAYYSLVSSLHHGDALGLAIQLDSEEKMDTPPSWAHLDTALICGLGSFLRCLAYFDEIARLGFRDRLEVVLGNYIGAVKSTVSQPSPVATES
jgi:hypothetical protein